MRGHRLALGAMVLVGWAAAAPAETARVCELVLADFVDGRHDLRVILYHRSAATSGRSADGEGAFYHGYAEVRGRGNLAHRVDTTPAAPFRFVRADGNRLRIKPEWKGTYAYHRDDWRALSRQYRDGELKCETYDRPEPIAWDGGRVAGAIDVWILPVDQANNWGLNAPRFLTCRALIDAAEKGRAIEGTYEAWSYDGKDETFGADRPRFEGSVTGRWLDDFWKPRRGSGYARGRDWPMARGPHLNGSAVDCGAELVENLHDARLLWVAEEPIPGGKGGRPKVDFGFYPANWSGMGYGAYGGPVVADGKVYAYFMYPDLERLAAEPKVNKHILCLRGADPALVASQVGALRHTVFCFDARTGRTLWKWQSDGTFGKPASGKSGKGLTPVVYDGKVYARGGGIYCLDARTGGLLWSKRGRDEKDRSYRSSGGWSRDHSPVVIGGTVVFHIYPDTTLVGLDPDTGEELWRQGKACGWDAVPTKVTLDGTEYVVTAYGVDIRTKGLEEDERMVLIDPASGEIVWADHRMGKTGVPLGVWETIVCGNVVKGLSGAEGKGVDDRMRAGAFRVSRRGAEHLWTAEEVHYPPHRATPVAHRGHFYIDSRTTGFACVEAATGRVVARHPHIYAMTGGDHNWTWHVATDGRIITSGCLMFTAGADGFRRMPGRLSLDLVGGYMCPVKPAVADGRLFVRTEDKLVCYDLRKPGGE